MPQPAGPSEQPDSPDPQAKAKKAAEALAKVREARETMNRLVGIIEQDGRYPIDAYIFLQEGLDFSVKSIHGERAARAARRRRKAKAGGEAEPAKTHPNHVDGRQLCRGLRDLAFQKWGRLAKTVLNAWNIHATDDFGEMVFVLVDNEFLQKTDNDHREDFNGVFPFGEMESEYTIVPGSVDVDEVHAH